MEVSTYTKVRKDLKKTMDSVCDNHSPIIVTRQNEKPVVMVSLGDFNAIQETVYLLNTPKNAYRISKALKEIEENQLHSKELLD